VGVSVGVDDGAIVGVLVAVRVGVMVGVAVGVGVSVICELLIVNCEGGVGVGWQPVNEMNKMKMVMKDVADFMTGKDSLSFAGWQQSSFATAISGLL